MGLESLLPNQTGFCARLPSRSVEKMELLEEISEHGAWYFSWHFDLAGNKLLNIKNNKGLFTIEWE